MITFYVVRHGNTENNRKGKLQGQIDTPLTDEGLNDAFFLANKLQGLSFDHVYSSDLGRAFITAHIIVERLHIEQKLTRARELREINYGIYQNIKSEDVKKICPQFKKDVDFVFPEGESFMQMEERVIHFLKDMEKRHNNKTLLIVSHASVIRAIICFFKGIDLSTYLHTSISHRYIGKMSIKDGKPFSYTEI